MSTPLTPKQQSRFRIGLALGGVVFATLIVGVVVFLPPSRTAPLPEFITSVSPLDTIPAGDTQPVVVAIDPDYSVELFVDQIAIPAAELETTARGVTWAPGEGRRRTDWTPGLHTVAVRWSGPAGDGEYRWSFEAG